MQTYTMSLPSENIINETVSHFSQYRQEPVTTAEATEIVLNFSGLARLLIKLDKKRSAEMTEREAEYAQAS